MVKSLVCPAEEPVSKNEKMSASSDDVADFEIPSSSPKKARYSASAPVQIGLQRFSDNSELCGLPGPQDKVVVIMMEHNAKPGYFFKFLEAFGTFLLSVHGAQNDFCLLYTSPSPRD